MDSARILIVEDDATLNDQLAGLLRNRGFRIDQCHDGHQGLSRALEGAFDLILLDVLLPRIDGFSVLNRLRKERQTPVMMLTACGAEEERIEGYSKGADDYMPKPFNFTEMLLRIDALLRRTRKAIEKTSASRLTLDMLTLTRSSQAVSYGDTAVSLTPIQFRLLWVLAENADEVLSKPYLYQTVLKRTFSRYDRALDMHLSRVRRKLMDAGMDPERLATIHGKGYRFS
ncbi:Transcriptional regulatory protein CpxR [BD1-7 clade bacterium]|uniref:Transcriptional regulatory protein CpxR n=1 Tax=BD1-7 clade bacterium TaxID=2029982 RepID=A0A5S9PGP2_9GAMM|nr:Transcriptional regulatory protein CpxR [BD1-7 clade bacterium]